MNQPPTVISEEAKILCRNFGLDFNWTCSGHDMKYGEMAQLAINKSTELVVKGSFEASQVMAKENAHLRQQLEQLQAEITELRRQIGADFMAGVVIKLEAENAKLKEDLQVVEHNSMASGQAGSMVQAHLREQLSKWQECVKWFEGYFETNIYGGGIPHCPWCYKRTDDDGKWATIPHAVECPIGKAISTLQTTEAPCPKNSL